MIELYKEQAKDLEEEAEFLKKVFLKAKDCAASTHERSDGTKTTFVYQPEFFFDKRLLDFVREEKYVHLEVRLDEKESLSIAISDENGINYFWVKDERFYPITEMEAKDTIRAIIEKLLGEPEIE